MYFLSISVIYLSVQEVYQREERDYPQGGQRKDGEKMPVTMQCEYLRDDCIHLFHGSMQEKRKERGQTELSNAKEGNGRGHQGEMDILPMGSLN